MYCLNIQTIFRERELDNEFNITQVVSTRFELTIILVQRFIKA